MNFGAPSFAYLLFLLPLLALLKIVADAKGQKAVQAFASQKGCAINCWVALPACGPASISACNCWASVSFSSP
ncbi:hypothetical protein [Verrucomicrobium spinosum]|uniref:hypothetical protein n=1 Tax=Verrucomicrobium spinosum TaxID=2736 RepID=UPI0009468431|nr:hypothetical protein [Verrucomicrobium spinosum]